MTGSLLNPEPPTPPNPWIKRIILAVVVLGAVGGVLAWQFRYYSEKKQVERFMDALVAGDYRQAYQLWNATSAYPYEKFLEDWGETSSFGRVRTYEIVGVSKSRGILLQVPLDGGRDRRTLHVEGGRSSGVKVLVRINGVREPVPIWVEKKDKRLSFPPY